MRISLFTLIFLFLLNLTEHVSAQPWDLNGNTTAGDFIGTTNNQPFPIYTFNQERMRVNGNGNVGIGTTTPAFKLDVNLGDVNLNQTDAATSEGYRIGGNRVLWHNNNTTNIFVGVGAGASNTNTSGINNTFVGYNTGSTNAGGSQLTLIGSGASVTSPNLVNATAIGAGAIVALNNSLVLGNGKINVGIGTSTPAYTLQVNGTIAANQILVTGKAEVKDLLVLIVELQIEVEKLKQQYQCLSQTN